MNNKLTPDQISDLRRLYVDEKLSTIKIGDMMGVRPVTIYRQIKRAGVEMRTVTKLTQEQIANLKRLYLDEKLSPIQIAKMMDVAQETIYHHLKRLGVEMRTVRVEQNLTPEQIADLKRLYVDDKLSTPKIAKMMGIHRATIYDHLNRLGVKR